MHVVLVAGLCQQEVDHSRFSPARARSSLREVLLALCVSNASLYRTHDLRRGHAQVLLSGCHTCVMHLRSRARPAAAVTSPPFCELEFGGAVAFLHLPGAHAVELMQVERILELCGR